MIWEANQCILWRFYCFLTSFQDQGISRMEGLAGLIILEVPSFSYPSFFSDLNLSSIIVVIMGVRHGLC